MHGCQSPPERLPPPPPPPPPRPCRPALGVRGTRHEESLSSEVPFLHVTLTAAHRRLSAKVRRHAPPPARRAPALPAPLARASAGGTGATLLCRRFTLATAALLARSSRRWCWRWTPGRAAPAWRWGSACDAGAERGTEQIWGRGLRRRHVVRRPARSWEPVRRWQRRGRHGQHFWPCGQRRRQLSS